MVSIVHLVDDVPDDISWTFGARGAYFAKSAYLAQLEELPTTIMKLAIWSNWAPPKCNFFCLVDHLR
jgi:hypothetical protein